VNGDTQHRAMLSKWPLPRPRSWTDYVNQPQTQAALRRSVNQGQPFGSDSWVRQTTKPLGLKSTIRRHGRPKKLRDTP